MKGLLRAVWLAVLAAGCGSRGAGDGSSRLQDLPSICGEPGAPEGVASGATLWTADNVSELQSALEEIVVRNIPCEVSLTDGIIDASLACDGQVRLSGELLRCNDELRGWRAIDGRTIELRGSACTDWRVGNAKLEARFPCYVVVQ